MNETETFFENQIISELAICCKETIDVMAETEILSFDDKMKIFRIIANIMTDEIIGE